MTYQPIPKLVKVILWTIGIWVVALSIIFIVPVPILSGFAGELSFLGALVLIVIAIVSLIKDKEKIPSLLALVLIVVTTLSILTFATSWGARLHFWLYRSRYEATIAKILAAKDSSERKNICGDDCWVMSEDSKRISFHYLHGFLNWNDIVYDPTGEVMTTDRDKKMQVSFYLVRAERLSGNWYLVHFGD